jgi:DNA-binding protein Fis
MTFQKLLNTKQFFEALKQAEKDVYLSAYAYAGGNQSRVASLVGVARGTAIYKLKTYGII